MASYLTQIILSRPIIKTIWSDSPHALHHASAVAAVVDFGQIVKSNQKNACLLWNTEREAQILTQLGASQVGVDRQRLHKLELLIVNLHLQVRLLHIVIVIVVLQKHLYVDRQLPYQYALAMILSASFVALILVPSDVTHCRMHMLVMRTRSQLVHGQISNLQTY